jgi:chromosome partitioning protein
MILVFGNTKGGTGKSTLAAHCAIELMYRGLRVVTLDCDGDQGTLSRYWENRRAFMAHAQTSSQGSGPLRVPADRLPMPVNHFRFSPQDQSLQKIRACLEAVHQSGGYDVILVDTAGYDSPLSRYGHGLADVLVTPVNDSAVDLDVLINIQGARRPGQLPLSQYATLVWEQRMEKTATAGRTLQWIVVRNRMHAIVSRNQETLEQVLRSLASRIGFQVGPCVAERIIFRELFAYGLTLLDYARLAAAHLTACQEVASLVSQILELASKTSPPSQPELPRVKVGQADRQQGPSLPRTPGATNQFSWNRSRL